MVKTLRISSRIFRRSRICKTRRRLDWLGKGVLAAEFEKTMIESKIGEVSEVFETQFGFHFLEVLEKRNYDMTRDLN